MVRIYKKSFKNAFTMIELIFAIVIVAISVLSLPMMAQINSEAIESNLIQEAIFAASSALSEATTFSWDENSLNDGDEAVVNGDSSCVAGTPNKRIGHVSRECLNNNGTGFYALAAYTKSIEVAAHGAQSIFIAGANPTAASYKDTYDSIVNVRRCDLGGCVQFGSTANNPNLKEIEIRITPTAVATDTLVLLRAYSANIGQITPYSGMYL